MSEMSLDALDADIRLLRDLILNEGEAEWSDPLMRALNIRGKALRGANRLAEALENLEESLALARFCAEQDGPQGEGAANLAIALMDYGVTLAEDAQPELALEAYREAAAVMQPLSEGEGGARWKQSRAAALTCVAETLVALEQVVEAGASYDEAIMLLAAFFREAEDPDILDQLIGLWNEKGRFLQALERYDLALECNDQAVNLSRFLVADHRNLKRTADFAASLWGQATSKLHLGEFEEAVNGFGEALQVKEVVYEESGSEETALDLARSAVEVGNTLGSIEPTPEALSLVLGAVEVCRKQLQKDATPALEEALARSLLYAGIGHEALGQAPEAIGPLDEAIGIYRRLTTQDVPPSVWLDFSRALTIKGDAMRAMGQSESALVVYDEGMAVVLSLVEDWKFPEYTSYVGAVVDKKAAILFEAGQPDAAIAAWEEVETLIRRLVMEGHQELHDYLGTALLFKGRALETAERPEEAVLAYHEAAVVARVEFGESPTPHKLLCLAEVLVTEAWAEQRLRNWPSALTCFDEAIELYRLLVDDMELEQFATPLADMERMRAEVAEELELEKHLQ